MVVIGDNGSADVDGGDGIDAGRGESREVRFRSLKRKE